MGKEMPDAKQKMKNDIPGLQQLLMSKGVKPSYQRLRILEYLVKMKNHPSVDMIFQELSQDIPTLSRTTIYNSLGLFLDKGIVSALTINDNEVRYDFMHHPHGHFLCVSCGKIYDVGLESDIFLLDDIEGHRPSETHIHFKGVCKRCLKG